MNWKDYELEVHDYFSKMYPNASVTYDARITGRYSKVARQIDVLIEDDIAGFPMKLVVDAKFFSINIDVKEVESFMGMLADVDANQGLLVTKKGYSKGAVNRAFNGPEKLELDILNFDELLEHQSMEAIPYSGNNALLLSSPFGWIIDRRQQEGFLASLYQRGIGFDEAKKRNEWIYFNFWHKDEQASNIKELVELQNARMKSIYTNLHLEEVRAPRRKDQHETFIRIAQFDEIKGSEITGFIDCGEFIPFFVLFTPQELQSKNLRKLSHLLKYSEPIKINFDNTQVIEQLESDLKDVKNPIERAMICHQLSNWYLEMDNKEEAARYKRMCNGYPQKYEDIVPFILEFVKSGNLNEAINHTLDFFIIDPCNPRIMQDLLSVFEQSQNKEWFERTINKLKKIYSKENEPLANICVHYAMYLNAIWKIDESIECYEFALNLFEQVDKNHYVIQQIKEVLKHLKSNH